MTSYVLSDCNEIGNPQPLSSYARTQSFSQTGQTGQCALTN